MTPAFLLLTACAPATWIVETWGEAYIEGEIPTADFSDGCSVTYDRFAVTFTDIALVDGNGDDVGMIRTPLQIDLVEPGPTELGRADVPADHYDRVRVVISPDDGPSVDASGTLTCDSASWTFAWTFQTDTTYACEPEDLTVAPSGQARTQLTVHGDHLWYDSLSSPDAELHGQAFADADADLDGIITLDELAAVPIAPTGLDVGPYSDVTDLRAFVTLLTQTLGHIDGEGHCGVDLNGG